jgi:hypothetical protein
MRELRISHGSVRRLIASHPVLALSFSITWIFLFRSMLWTRLRDPLHELREPFPSVGVKLYLVLLRLLAL